MKKETMTMVLAIAMVAVAFVVVPQAIITAAQPTTQAVEGGYVDFELNGDAYGPMSIEIAFDTPFEEPPIVVITPASDLAYRWRVGRPYTFAVVSITEEGAVIRARRSEAFYNETIRMNWIAVGQTNANFVDVGRPQPINPKPATK